MRRLPDACRLLRRYQKPILAVALVATIVGGYFSSKLSVQSDLSELLPESFPSVQALRRVREEVGGVSQLRIVLSTQDFAAARRLAHDLEPKLLSSPYVSYVDYRKDVDFYRRYALLFLDPAELDSLYGAVEKTIEGAKRRLNPFLVDDLFTDGGGEESETDELEAWEEKYEEYVPSEYYTNADSSVLVMRVYPSRTSTDLAFSRAMVSDIRGIVEAMHPERYAPDLKVYYGGNISNRIDEYETVISDILGTALYGVAGVSFLIFLYFRSALATLLIGVSLLTGLTWTFGVTDLAIGQLNTITGFLFVILFGLGIDYGLHAFARYRESRQVGLNHDAAMHKMVCQTGSALATTAFTTSAAFFSLMLMDFRGFSELGFIAGVGLIFAFVAMVVILPALIFGVERLGLLRIAEVPAKAAALTKRGPFKFSKGILTGAALVTLGSVYGLAHVDFEYDFTDLRVITEQRQKVSELTRGVFKRSESPAIVLTDSREEVEEVVEAVRRKMQEDTVSPTIESVRSIFSLVPDDQQVRLAKIRAIRELVEEEAEGVVSGDTKRRIEELESYLAVDRPFSWDELPQADKRQFLTKDGEVGNFVFIYPSVPLRDGRNAIEFRKDVGEIKTESGKTFYAASPNIIQADMLIVMTREGKLAVGLSLLLVFLIVLANFRDLRAATLVISPLVIGVVWMGGAMYLLGMKLNMFNIVVVPSIIGIGVDAGVHIYHRYLEEGPGSLPLVLRRTGLAVVMTTLTTIAGYSGLLLARHPGLVSIGQLAVIGLSTTLVSAVIVLPALIQVFEKKGAAVAVPEPESAA